MAKNAGNSPKFGIGVVVLKDGRMLLGKRISHTHGDGAWSLPGGHLEMWEGFEDCCRREVMEETGIQTANIRKLSFTNDLFRETDLHHVTLYFAAVCAGGEPENLEPHKCWRWEWFDIQNLPEPLFCGIREALSESGLL